MDLKMPVMNGIQATRHIHEKHPNIKVLVLTTYAEDQWVFDAIRGGAGYLLKDTPRESLIAAIKNTAAGKTHIDPEVAGKLFDHMAQKIPDPNTSIIAELSERERDVLRLLARGLSNADIAARLYLSEGTVRNYVIQSSPSWRSPTAPRPRSWPSVMVSSILGICNPNTKSPRGFEIRGLCCSRQKHWVFS
jgi:DNA-binding NarL/FixJ family response regulator